MNKKYTESQHMHEIHIKALHMHEKYTESQHMHEIHIKALKQPTAWNQMVVNYYKHMCVQGCVCVYMSLV